MILMESGDNNKCIGSEYLSNDILEENFANLFKPFHMVQNICGACRVDVRDRFVTAPSILQKCYTIICVIMTLFASTCIVETYSTQFAKDPGMVNLWRGVIYGVCVVYSVSIIHARFFNNVGNVKLYIKMQEIDRLMKLNVNKSINSRHYKNNLTTSLIMVALIGIILVLSVILSEDKVGLFGLLGATWTFTALIFELSCCSSNIKYFTIRIRLINSIITDHFKRKTGHDVEFPCKQCKSLDAQWSFDSCDIDVFLTEILNGFKCFKNQYRFQIFLFCAELLAFVLFTFEYGILTLKSSASDKKYFMLLDVLHLSTISFIEVILLLVLCTLSEMFFREVEKTKKLSIFVLSRYIHGPLRKKSKNMLELIEDMPPCFSVYGMWRVNARLTLNIFQITTTYLVIILQFAFL